MVCGTHSHMRTHTNTLTCWSRADSFTLQPGGCELWGQLELPAGVKLQALGVNAAASLQGLRGMLCL